MIAPTLWIWFSLVAAFMNQNNANAGTEDYFYDTTERIPWSYNVGPSLPCKCDPRGSISNDCVGGICQCKTNVEGNNCDRCREGTFGLNGSIAEGCQSCFCSGMATQCHESNLYIEQISSQIFDSERHGFTLTDQYQNEKIRNNFQLNISMKEIGYTFRASTTDQLFWSLPSTFTGFKIKSYGGKLEFTQRYTQGPDAQYIMDQDIIMMGNGISIYWSNPVEQRPNIANKVSVTLSPSSKWQRLDFSQGPKPASREDILKVLANLNAILIRAQLSGDTGSTFISDLTLDTAVDFYTGQSKATNVEVCVCPSGYSGTSCELCAPGRDLNNLRKGPLGSCSQCPCSGREVSCKLGPDNRVTCNCLPGYVGQSCENTRIINAIFMDVKQQENMVDIKCSYKANRHLKIEITLDGTRINGYRTGNEIVVTTNVRNETLIKCNPWDVNTVIGSIITYLNKESEPTPRPPPGVLPTIIVQISSPQLSEVGSQVRFNCSAISIASNNVDIHWSKADGHLPDRAIYDRRGLLVITHLKFSDSGKYICKADDGVSVVTKYVNLAVGGNREESPRVQIQPSFLEVNVGDPIDLHCRATGNPAPTLQWTKVNRDHLNLRHTFTNGIFRVENAAKSDEGEYQCTARNSAGTETARTIVHVKEVPGTFVRPIISPAYYTGTSGESFTLSCKAGPGQQRIYWTKQHGHLPYNSRDENGILIVTDARTEDSGNYICTVQDYAGRHGNATANVNIISRDTGSNQYNKIYVDDKEGGVWCLGFYYYPLICIRGIRY